MSDRNLRALDMRHTLPNLKNLLLTLSDGEGARLGWANLLQHERGLMLIDIFSASRVPPQHH